MKINGETIQNVMEPDVIIKKEYIYTKEELELLEQICDRGLLKIIDGVPTCGQQMNSQGIRGQLPFIYTKGHTNEGNLKTVEDIISTCEQCKQRYIEDPRIKELMQTIIKISVNRKAELYFCMHDSFIEGNPFTFVPEAKFPCPLNNRQVRIDRTCIKTNCPYFRRMSMDIPSIHRTKYEEPIDVIKNDIE
jgi:hypothetical protein